jgi:hypothetical protein
MRFGIGAGAGVLAWLIVGCASTEDQPAASEQRRFPDHPACDIRDEDYVCEVDADCEHVGTRIEPTGQCCYAECGGGATVNQAAAKRLLPERDRINTGPPRDGCPRGHDSKCSAGYPACTDGRCTLRRQ